MSKQQINCSWLRNIRINKGYSIDEVANMLGKHRATVLNYENGKTNMSVDTLVKIANIYDIDLKELIQVIDEL